MRKELTNREKDVINFIISYQKIHGYSPSVRDIQKGIFLNSPSTVLSHLNNLKIKGYISFDNKIARSIVIKNKTVV